MTETEKLDKSIEEIWKDEYIVPLYQRNYAWRENEIIQLLQDIYDSFRKDKEGNYYIGSLVVLKRQDGKYEVVDGQQRLTTLHIICKYFGILDAPKLSYDSRPEVEEFFQGLFHCSSITDYHRTCQQQNCQQVYRLVEALDIVTQHKVHRSIQGGKDDQFSLSELADDERCAFAAYINNRVILVRTILPSDTDVAAYFEIMNNRGEQLQEHEILKAKLLDKFGLQDSQARAVYAEIWDACSQMDIPVQQTLTAYRNHPDFPLFGEHYDSLNIENIQRFESKTQEDESKSIDEILASNETPNTPDTKQEDKEVKYKAIIDFPNFLMHILKTYSANTPLNATELLAAYNNIDQTMPIVPKDFINELLKYRVLFDRFIIKSLSENDEDENIKWTLRKPYCYQYKGLYIKFQNTFSPSDSNEESDETEEESDIQKRIIKQLSMLQVTFRSRNYKNWLYDLLTWLGEFKSINEITADNYSAMIDQWIIDYYKNLDKRIQATNNQGDKQDISIFCAGTKTPHFLFNLIDYLYWRESRHDVHNINHIELLKDKDFTFKYYNSVEHHLPQSYQSVDGANLDDIGNLCLISRRKNSSLNDKGPTEKAKIEEGLQPKRLIMYTMTKQNNNWGKAEIEQHSKDLQELLKNIEEILHINK